MWSGIKDPKTEFIGTGPFMIDKYLPEDRLTFKRNPNYWMKDAEGNQLPYLDGMEFIFMAEPSAQVEALRGGQVDYLIYLPSEFVKTLKEDQNIQVLEKPSNTAFVLRMRSDKKPFDDVKVRQAFKRQPTTRRSSRQPSKGWASSATTRRSAPATATSTSTRRTRRATWRRRSNC